MKKYIFTLLSLMTLLFFYSSCTDSVVENIDDSSENVSDKVSPIEYNVEIEQFHEDGLTESTDEGSRATLAKVSDYKHNVWETGDVISVLSSSKAYALTLKSGAGTTRGIFTGDAPESAAPIVSPYQKDQRASSTRIADDVRIPTFQRARANSYDKGAAPMFGISDGVVTTIQKTKSIQLHNTTALICVRADFECDSIVLNSNGLEPICGLLKLSYSFDEDWPNRTVNSEQNFSIGLRGENGATLKANTDYYIAVLPQTLNSGFTICCRATDDHKVYMFSTSLKTEFKRNNIYRYDKFTKKKANGSGVVDLGLDSGVKLAAMNDGAMRISEPGDYYAWGETVPRPTSSDFTPQTYTKFSDGTTTGDRNGLSNKATLTKYVKEVSAGSTGKNGYFDNQINLADEDDALIQKYGDKKYRIPTLDIAKDIQANTTIEWTTLTEAGKTRSGIWIKSKKSGNNNKVWLSLTGFWAEGTNPYGASSAQFRIASLNPDDNDSWVTADFLANNGGNNIDAIYGIGWTYRYEGIPVRAVRVPDHTYVNMGPAGKWATCNVGAQTATQFGGYYAWGEIMEKPTYSWDYYKWGASESKLLKYNNVAERGVYDCIYTLKPEDDVAIAEWGNDWYMPSYTDFEKLISNCVMTPYNGSNTKYYGTAGIEFKVKSGLANAGNTIFLPLSGYKSGTGTIYTVMLGSKAYNCAIYSTKTLDTSNPSCQMGYYMTSLAGSEIIQKGGMSCLRTLGASVRPMHK